MDAHDKRKILELEWIIFSELCPDSIMKTLLDDDISLKDVRVLTKVLEILGFSAMADKFEKDEIAKHMKEKNKQKLYITSPDEQEIRAMTRAFIDNIKSPGLRKTFAAAAHEEAYFAKNGRYSI